MGALLTAALMIVVYVRNPLQRSRPFFNTLRLEDCTVAGGVISAHSGASRSLPLRPEHSGSRELKWLLPGSIFAAVVWMVASILFKVYVRHFSHFGLLYGSLGALIILMFWFYLSGIVILAGGEINAILEDAAAKQRFRERKGADSARRFS